MDLVPTAIKWAGTEAGKQALTMGIYAVGTGMQALAERKQGKAQESAYRKQAAIAAAEAKRAKEVYAEQAREHRKEAKRLKARQIVLYAKSGVKAGVGTPLLVTKESREQMEAQARVIQEHGEFAYSQGMSESSLQKQMGKAASRAGLWAAGSTLATGLGTIGRMRQEYGLLKKKRKT